MKKLLLLGLLLLAGCDKPEELIANNNKELKSGGVVIGTFPDGRQIRSYRIRHPNDISDNAIWENETILVIEPKDPSDKTVLINGKLYAPLETETETSAK